MNRACFPKEKAPEFTKMGEIHELFVLALSLVWFAGATPENTKTWARFSVRAKMGLTWIRAPQKEVGKRSSITFIHFRSLFGHFSDASVTFFVTPFARLLLPDSFCGKVNGRPLQNRGRPHRKVCFSAAPMVGTNLMNPGHPGVRVRNLVARAIHNAIRTNRLVRIIRNSNPYFYSASGRFARITRISESRESRH